MFSHIRLDKIKNDHIRQKCKYHTEDKIVKVSIDGLAMPYINLQTLVLMCSIVVIEDSQRRSGRTKIMWKKVALRVIRSLGINADLSKNIDQ